MTTAAAPAPGTIAPLVAPMPRFASPAVQYMAAPARMSFDYGLLLARDIPADTFAHMPHPTMNHPAFNFGHLSLYPNRIFLLIDRKDLIEEDARYAELFAAGKPCVEQDGRYPHKDEIMQRFTDAYRKAYEVLPAVTDAVLAQPNPIEGRMRERLPLVGIAVNFLLNNHVMSHLGQVSAWRRAMGMAGVM
jgi:hypothetical protein